MHWTTTSALTICYMNCTIGTNASVTEPGSTLKILHNIKLFPSEATCSKHTFTKISTFLNLCFPLQSRRAELLTNLCVFFVFGKAAPKQDEGLHFLQKPGTIIITTWGIMVC